jgi:hypothetical protein
LVSYDVNDADPTRKPSSDEVIDVRLPVHVGRSWTQVTVAVQASWLQRDGLAADMLLPYLTLDPPRVGRSWLRYDDLQVLELRSARGMPSVYGAWDVVYNGGPVGVELSVPAVE